MHVRPLQELAESAIENYTAATRLRRANLVHCDLAALFLYVGLLTTLLAQYSQHPRPYTSYMVIVRGSTQIGSCVFCLYAATGGNLSRPSCTCTRCASSMSATAGGTWSSIFARTLHTARGSASISRSMGCCLVRVCTRMLLVISRCSARVYAYSTRRSCVCSNLCNRYVESCTALVTKTSPLPKEEKDFYFNDMLKVCHDELQQRMSVLHLLSPFGSSRLSLLLSSY